MKHFLVPRHSFTLKGSLVWICEFLVFRLCLQGDYVGAADSMRRQWFSNAGHLSAMRGTAWE